ncbi:MAG TPA: serine/threonine-protein kinase, partial [Anaerolineae bacterium]|nr:serine/threonine-protein kinase [Anaerolineae bacterium]
MDELIGKAFGPFTIVEKIAEGGMAVVYKGYQESLNRYVAIKILRRELTQSPEFVARFRKEALAVARLSHPNILHVYDADAAHGRYYIVMDYVEGGTLKDLLTKGPLDAERAVDIAAQLADALDYAHQQGIVHRDVKPANVLLTRDGRPLLTDFGIARALDESTHLTRTGTSIGTPAYMAPEQAQGQQTDGRTDIYALGIVLYEMLAGLVPFSAPTPVATLYKHVNEPPPPLRQVNVRVPPWLEAAVNKALAKRPEDRYQRAKAFADALRQHKAPATKPTPGTAATARPAAKGKKTAVMLIGAAIIVLLVLLGSGAYLLLETATPTATTPTPATLVALATTPAPTATLAPTWTPSPSPSPSPSPTAGTPTPLVLVVTATATPTSVPTATPPPTSSPAPTPTRAKPTTKPTASSSGQPGVIADFETFGSWRRGDEANGTFRQSSTQKHQGSYAGKLSYNFGTTDNDYVVFEQKHKISGQPKYITAWVYGDGSGHFLNVWIQDKQGQVWQVPLGRVTHTGWQQMVGALDVNQKWPWTHISGPDNGAIDYPVSFYALVLDDNPDRFTGSGTIYVDDLQAETQLASVPGGGGTGTTSTPAPQATAPPSTGGDLSGRIVFTVYNAGIGSYTLYMVKPDGSGLHAIADYVHHPDLSPDGRRIVVDGVGGGKDDLWHFKVDGSDWQHLTTHPDDHFPTWSPNGLVVVFSSTRQGDGVYRLYTPDAPIGTDKTKFVLGDYPVWLPTWEIAFNGCDYGWGTGARCGLWRVSDGHTPTQITDDPQDIPTDGTADALLFLRPDGNNWDVYRISLKSGALARLTDDPANDGPAAFSPDGQSIAFLSNRSGKWALYTMNRQGGNVKKVIDLPSGGNYGSAPHPWTQERISWGPPPAQGPSRPTPTPSGLLPAPQITFPIPDDTVSSRKATTIRWTWDGQLAFNQGFEVRVWHTSESTPMGVAPPTAETQLTVNFGLTDAYRQHGEGFYYLDVVVVQLNPY